MPFCHRCLFSSFDCFTKNGIALFIHYCSANESKIMSVEKFPYLPNYIKVNEEREQGYKTNQDVWNEGIRECSIQKQAYYGYYLQGLLYIGYMIYMAEI